MYRVALILQIVVLTITVLVAAQVPKSQTVSRYTTPLSTGVRLDPEGEFIDLGSMDNNAGIRVPLVSGGNPHCPRKGCPCESSKKYCDSDTS